MKEVGISANLELKTEKGKVIDTVNEYAVLESDRLLSENRLYTKGEEESFSKISKYQLANLATSIIFWAISKATEDGLVPIIGYVTEDKDTLRKYQQKRKDWEKAIEDEKDAITELETEKKINDAVNQRVREIMAQQWLEPAVIPTSQEAWIAPTQVWEVKTASSKKEPENKTKDISFMGGKLTVHNELPKRKKKGKTI